MSKQKLQCKQQNGELWGDGFLSFFSLIFSPISRRSPIIAVQQTKYLNYWTKNSPDIWCSTLCDGEESWQRQDKRGGLQLYHDVRSSSSIKKEQKPHQRNPSTNSLQTLYPFSQVVSGEDKKVENKSKVPGGSSSLKPLYFFRRLSLTSASSLSNLFNFSFGKQWKRKRNSLRMSLR